VFADTMNARPKHVVSSTLTALSWNATPLTGDLPAAVTRLKESVDGPILVAGSATLVQGLLTHGLVDGLRLMVHPVAVGGGLTSWPQQRQKIPLVLAELTRYHSGVVLQIYRPAPEP
jgi:dihydrofolate reductase